MKKRLKFKCFKCKRNFSLLLEIMGEPKLTVVCPYCAAGCIADLAPFRKETVEVVRGDKQQELQVTWDFPESIPTTESH